MGQKYLTTTCQIDLKIDCFPSLDVKWGYGRAGAWEGSLGSSEGSRVALARPSLPYLGLLTQVLLETSALREVAEVLACQGPGWKKGLPHSQANNSLGINRIFSFLFWLERDHWAFEVVLIWGKKHRHISSAVKEALNPSRAVKMKN